MTPTAISPRRALLARCLAAGLCATFLPTLAWATAAEDAAEAQKVVSRAQGALAEVLKQPDFDSLRAGIKQAKAVLIFPRVLKAGFLLGGAGGNGVLLVRQASGVWSAPAFYSMGAVSFGVQAGAQESAVIVLVNSTKAIDGLMENSLKLGAGFSAAVGPQGAGQAANVTADFVSYSKAKGAFVGMSLEGSVLDVRDTLNKAYFGKELKPAQIVRQAATDAHSAALRKAVTAAAR
jgi:SH3 domain-containing YSC84-like protein 1